MEGITPVKTELNCSYQNSDSQTLKQFAINAIFLQPHIFKHIKKHMHKRNKF